MTYIVHDWVDGGAPAIDAETLTKIEKGITDAHTGVEEAKSLANTNTILISPTLEFSETEKQYKLPVDDFSFEKYQIFGWYYFGDGSILENINYTDDSGSYNDNKGWFEAHKAGKFLEYVDYGDGFCKADISNEGVITTIGSGVFKKCVTVRMIVIPVSKKSIVVLP